MIKVQERSRRPRVSARLDFAAVQMPKFSNFFGKFE